MVVCHTIMVVFVGTEKCDYCSVQEVCDDTDLSSDTGSDTLQVVKDAVKRNAQSKGGSFFQGLQRLSGLESYGEKDGNIALLVYWGSGLLVCINYPSNHPLSCRI